MTASVKLTDHSSQLTHLQPTTLLTALLVVWPKPFNLVFPSAGRHVASCLNGTFRNIPFQYRVSICWWTRCVAPEWYIGCYSKNVCCFLWGASPTEAVTTKITPFQSCLSGISFHQHTRQVLPEWYIAHSHKLNGYCHKCSKLAIV